MASAAVIAAVEARLAGFATPVKHPNADFATPADGSAFVSVQYPVASERQTTFGAPGNNVFREEGAIRFVVAVPLGSGLDAAAAIADALRALFRNARFGGVRTYAPSTLTADDRGTDGTHFRASFAVPYDHDLHA